jgi:hypothetical protein
MALSASSSPHLHGVGSNGVLGSASASTSASASASASAALHRFHLDALLIAGSQTVSPLGAPDAPLLVADQLEEARCFRAAFPLPWDTPATPAAAAGAAAGGQEDKEEQEKEAQDAAGAAGSRRGGGPQATTLALADASLRAAAAARRQRAWMDRIVARTIRILQRLEAKQTKFR